MRLDVALRTVPDTDDRRTCAQCQNGARPGPCQAARRGEITASNSYDPDRKTLRRCEGFKPLPGEKDQRTGRQRWPYLTYQPIKGSNKK